MKIAEFKGEFSFLSNFHPAVMTWEGIQYPTSEHAYQSAKTFNMDIRIQVANLATPGQAKRFGKTIPIRKDWEDVKVSIMYDIVQEKFAQNSNLRELLMATRGFYLEEGNRWDDTFWGVCRGKGKNILGEILMSVRTNLEFFVE